MNTTRRRPLLRALAVALLFISLPFGIASRASEQGSSVKPQVSEACAQNTDPCYPLYLSICEANGRQNYHSYNR